MLHKWEVMMGLPEGSLTHQLEEHYLENGCPEAMSGEMDNKTEGEWMPDIGETVLFKRTDSIDYAWDTPEKMEVVAVVGNEVWLKNTIHNLVTNLGNISPVEKENPLREKLVEIMSRRSYGNFIDVHKAADLLIAAGIKLEKKYGEW